MFGYSLKKIANVVLIFGIVVIISILAILVERLGARGTDCEFTEQGYRCIDAPMSFWED